MGLAGFTISSQKLAEIFNIPPILPVLLLYLSIGTFLTISLVFLVRIIRYPNEVKLEFNNPIKLSFFPAFSISLLLFSIAFLSVNNSISLYFWVFGTLVQFIFTIKIISVWMHHNKFEMNHMNPAWFIPAVGNILIPIAGVSHFYPDISWFFFSIGLLFWIILMTILFNRIIFHQPFSEKLLPTLFILIAPPAVGFISLIKLTGEISSFAKILYFFGLFLTILLLTQIKRFYKIRFYLSWWAYSFPIAAISIATALMYHITKFAFYRYLYLTLYLFLILIITYLIFKTIKSILSKQICVGE
jgi:tellurite resistance protein